MLIGVLVLAALAAALLTGIVRQYALRRALIDFPNTRSSHTAPTPRGGGLSIALICLPAFTLLGLTNVLSAGAAAALAVGGVLIALVGWLDDHQDVRPRWRLLAQFVAAGSAVYFMGGLDSIVVGTWNVTLGLAGSLLAVAGLVWVTNLFNFMDGVDGLAAAEAIAVTGIGGLLLLGAGATGLATSALLIAAAASGFLVWNWPPARIFMGDVGSGLLGYLLGVLALLGEATGTVPLLLWLTLLGVFVFDATVTLFRRILRRERWYEPHRSHAYQRAVQAGWSHRQVTTSILLLNGVLGALAVAAWLRPASVVPVLVVASAILWGSYRFVGSRKPVAAPPTFPVKNPLPPSPAPGPAGSSPRRPDR